MRVGLRIVKIGVIDRVHRLICVIVKGSSSLAVEEADLILCRTVVVGDSKVEIAVDIQVGHGEGGGCGTNWVSCHRLEGAVSIAEKDADGGVSSVQHSNVEKAILVEVPKCHLRRSIASRKTDAGGREVALSVVEQHINQVASIGRNRDDIREAVSVEIARGHVADGIAEVVDRLRSSEQRVAEGGDRIEVLKHNPNACARA